MAVRLFGRLYIFGKLVSDHLGFRRVIDIFLNELKIEEYTTN